MEANKLRKQTNISSEEKKDLICDEIKTQCHHWVAAQLSGKWTAFLPRLLNVFLLQAFFFLLLKHHCCSGEVTSNDLGVYAARLQLNAPMILVLLSEQALTTHPTSLILS